MKNVVLDIVYDKQTDEYIIPWVEDGKHIEGKTYYTDDLEDAENTLVTTIQWAQRHEYDVRIKGDRFIPDIIKKLKQERRQT